MNFLDLLRTAPGIVSVVGSGGKSTLVASLAQALPSTVVVATTTHMLPVEGLPLLVDPSGRDVAAELARHRALCVGSWADGPRDKLRSPDLGIPALASLAEWVLVEADGSRRLPLKAHAAHEPVIPDGSAQTIQLVGASGFGGRVADVVHRSELFCGLAGCGPDDACTPELAARAVAAEHARGIVRADLVVVNQADDDAGLAQAARFAEALRACGDCVEVLAGSVRARRLLRL